MSRLEDAPALARAALERFGHRLSAEEVEILVSVARHVEAALADLRAFELDDADEPASRFKAGEGRDT